MPASLLAELRRLYAVANLAPDAAQLPLVDVDGAARALLIEFPQVGDWPRVGASLQYLADELGLPPPALSVSATGAYVLWLAFATPRPLPQLAAFYDGLRAACLSDLPGERLRCHPLDGDALVPVIPAFDAETERWSAFIDPGMGSMFVTEPGLEFPPNPERQAEMLAGLKAIDDRQFARALAQLPALCSAPALAASPLSEHFSDPAAFLLAVMNDAKLPVGERISAASALLAATRR